MSLSSDIALPLSPALSPQAGRGRLFFSGYAAVFDRVDRCGDVFLAGAFGEVGSVPLLWRHGGAPVGEARVREDDRGLRVEGVIGDSEVASLVRSGAVAGLSVGYRPFEVRQGAYRELVRVRLVEVSLVGVPMQGLARVERWWDAPD